MPQNHHPEELVAIFESVAGLKLRQPVRRKAIELAYSVGTQGQAAAFVEKALAVPALKDLAEKVREVFVLGSDITYRYDRSPAPQLGVAGL